MGYVLIFGGPQCIGAPESPGVDANRGQSWRWILQAPSCRASGALTRAWVQDPAGSRRILRGLIDPGLD
eukprot:8807713-Pyramimonas_sp.AAC.1